MKRCLISLLTEEMQTEIRHQLLLNKLALEKVVTFKKKKKRKSGNIQWDNKQVFQRTN